MPKKSQPKVKKLVLKMVKSPIGYPQRQKDTLRALGLRKMHQSIEHKDSPVIRGMIAKVIHLVEVTEQDK
jgi:large subunit ribosomal protein L30